MTQTAKNKSNTAWIFLVSLISGVLLLSAAVALPQKSFADNKSSASADLGSTVSNVVGNASAGANASASASTQSGGSNASANADVRAQYKSSYDKKSADSNDEVVVSTDHHLYKPGDQVRIDGDVSSAIIASLQLSQVSIQVNDNSGATVDTNTLQLNSDGSYGTSFALPSDAKQGAYTVQSTLQVRADLLGPLSADVKAKLSTSSKFVVVSPNAFAIKAQVNGQDEDFSVQIASNSTVSNVALDVNQKVLTFQLDGESGTHGVTQITIPKAMLSGDLRVMMDGAAMSNSDVIVVGETSADSTLELNYHHSTHTVTIAGTEVAPEFPVSTALLTVGVLGSMAVLATRFVRFQR